MKTVERLLAEKLLKISAIKLQPENPFVWASGWNSPIYTDNRRTLSYPEVRTFIKVELCRVIMENFGEVDAIAGVATRAIAQGALVAETLGLPYVYVRSAPKDHGLENLIEGNLKPGQKVVVIEDLISTGGSSLKAVEAIRNAGCEVIGMAAIFTYGFPVAARKFKSAQVELITLSNYNAMLETALETNYIKPEDLETLQEWRKDPASWQGPNNSNLERFKGALNAPGNEKLKITGYDKDSLSIEVSPIGSITFRIIDREPNKTIKFEAENSPLPLNLWIQLVSTGENETASRITVKAELNPFIKPMVSKPLQEGVDKMADMLVILPYE